ncbi:MAG: chloride channel protein [Clostridia bacterium]|nr:chloride channel protein [Clostridia bacterium]
MKKYKYYIINLLLPAFVFGSVTGIITALLVSLYKLCAKIVIDWSEKGYQLLSQRLYFIPILLIAFFGIALLFSYIYKKIPNLKGGGIPTSIGILRGIITFKWLRNLVGIFLMSLASFMIGVPLGNEGPSVQMGTAVGRGTVYTFAKNHKAWDRYSMTGGACAGFSVATGAPISGILFAIEEAHQRISPTILIVSSVSVMFANIASEIISPLLGVSVSLFPELTLVKLSLKNIWIPVLVGVTVGFFAVLFLYYYKAINGFFNKKLRKIHHAYKIFTVLSLTLLFGLISSGFVSTGHELILDLLHGKTEIYMLFLILIVRSTLTLSANTNKITGGMFIPMLTLGAVLSSLLGEIIELLFGLEHQYYMIILVLGIVACISSMMKMPLTAIIFAIEALGCYENILYVVVASAVSFMITEIFGAKSINDTVVEDRVEELNDGKDARVIDTYVRVSENAFAVGKQIRDIFWPANLFVLSVKHDQRRRAEVDEHGGKALREGDILHVRYSTYDEAESRAELLAIVGNQDFMEKIAVEV